MAEVATDGAAEEQDRARTTTAAAGLFGLDGLVTIVGGVLLTTSTIDSFNFLGTGASSTFSSGRVFVGVVAIVLGALEGLVAYRLVQRTSWARTVGIVLAVLTILSATDGGTVNIISCLLVGGAELGLLLAPATAADMQGSRRVGARGPTDTSLIHLRAPDEAMLRVEHLVVEFPVARTGLKVHAVTDLSIDVVEGETLGLVGESGCGKSTTGRAIVQLPRPTSGSVVLDGEELTVLQGEALRQRRPRMQMIFQDPISSLNPRRKVKDIIAEGLDIWSMGDQAARDAKVIEVLNAVGIDPKNADRRPHEFSGGQCQRISIARAMITEPKLIICDEPVSALDVSVQAQIINLLDEMKVRYGLTLIFIAHDLAVVKNVSDRVAVMYLGKICELGEPDTMYANPAHPYTAALLAAIPVPDPDIRPDEEKVLGGEIPSPMRPPSGCRFRTRCPKAQEKCASEEPAVREIRAGQFAACHFPLEPGEQLDFAKVGVGGSLNDETAE